MAGSDSLTDQIRGWFERTPKAQRAVRKLSADLDVVAGHVEKATSGLMEKVAPIIDPPTSMAPGTQAPASPEPESSVPPGVKRDGEPVDPTT
jgi:hypothetical protein